MAALAFTLPNYALTYANPTLKPAPTSSDNWEELLRSDDKWPMKFATPKKKRILEPRRWVFSSVWNLRLSYSDEQAITKVRNTEKYTTKYRSSGNSSQIPQKQPPSMGLFATGNKPIVARIRVIRRIDKQNNYPL